MDRNQRHMDMPDLGQDAMQRCLVDERAGEGCDRRAFLAEIGGNRQPLEPSAPYLVDVPLPVLPDYYGVDQRARPFQIA